MKVLAVLFLLAGVQSIRRGAKPLMDNDECKAFCRHNQDELPNGHAFGSVTNTDTPVTVCIHKCDKDYPVLVQKPLMDNDSCKAFCAHNTAELPGGKSFGSITNVPAPSSVCMKKCDKDYPV